MILNDKPDWWDGAICRTGSGQMLRFFYPPNGGRGSYDIARSMCHSCPVLAQCRKWSLDADVGPYGMFGGMTPRERTQAREERRRAAA